MTTVRSTVEVDPLHAYGYEVPDKGVVQHMRRLSDGTLVGHVANRDGWPCWSWSVFVPHGDTLTVYAPEEN